MTGCLCEINRTEEEQRESDICLYEEADCSMFVNGYQRPFRFMHQNVALQYEGTAEFGQSVFVPLNLKRAHALSKMTCAFTLPALRHPSEKVYRNGQNCSNVFDNSEASHCVVEDDKSMSSNKRIHHNSLPERYAFWVNAIGHVLIKKVILKVNDIPIITHCGEYMEILDELTTSVGKNTDEIIGRHHTLRKLWLKSKLKQVRYVPIRMFFCESIEQSLMIFAIDETKSKLTLEIQIRDLKGCYYASNGKTPCLRKVDKQLCSKDIELTVYADIYYLIEDELKIKYESGHKYLISQVHSNGDGQLIKNASSKLNIPHLLSLPFAGRPISEIHCIIQPECHVYKNDWFNWSGLCKDDPLQRAFVNIGGNTHMSEREGKWLRTMVPMKHHRNVPGKHIYSICFAEKPEKSNVISGSYTPVSNDDVQLGAKLQKRLGPCLFKCYGISWNSFEITSDHQAGVAFE